MRRVCLLITRMVVGGAQRIALETALAAKAAGWEVELWHGPETGIEGSLLPEARRRGLTLRLVPHLMRDVRPLDDARALAFLVHAFRKERFDLVHTHSSKAGILGRIAARVAGIPHVLHTVHGWGFTPATHPLMKPLYVGLERACARLSDYLVAVSEAVRDSGLSFGIGRESQYVVIHGGIDPGPLPGSAERIEARRRLGLPEETAVVGTLGRLDPSKDPIGALEALAPAVRKRGAYLLFVGGGQLEHKLAQRAKRLGIGASVLITGTREDARHLLPAVDVFFSSSKWEGFPLAILEAMAARLPVVAFDVAGIREAVLDGRTGYLLPRAHWGAWRERVEKLLLDGQLRSRLGAAGRVLVESRFSIERMLTRTLDVYKRISGCRQ